jgi:predicted metal-dependent hydrolase
VTVAEHAISIGRTVVPFRVRRSKARSQVSLVVEAGREGVLVVAPAGTTRAQLEGILRSRAAWLLGKLRHVAGAEERTTKREFVSGESFTYLGRSFRLRVRSGEEQKARLDSGWLEVRVPRGLRAADRRRAVRGAVVRWFRERAAARLPRRLPRFTEKLGVESPPVLLREQARRWGSCTAKGEVRLNWRILQAPMALVDYVVAHEAVHLKHRNHTAQFWAELAKLMPDADVRRFELARRGAAWVW